MAVLLAVQTCFAFKGTNSGELSKGKKIYGRMESFLKGKPNMAFDFIRIIESPYTGECDSLRGSIKINRDGFARVDIDNRIIIERSDTLYDYSGDGNQLTISPGKRGMIKQLLLSEYLGGNKVVGWKDNGRWVEVSLEPTNDDNEYKDIRMIMMEQKGVSAYLPKKLHYIDGLGRRITWEFSKFNFAPSFNSETFTFSPPDGCRVVNLFER